MSERVPFHTHIRPLLLLNETNGSQQPILAVRSNSTLLCTATCLHLPISTAPPLPLLRAEGKYVLGPVFQCSPA